MTYELPPLPYAMDALAPHISAETLEYHYGKHHAAYVNNLNKMVPGSDYEGASVDELVMQASGGIFNNAAQVWNHSFYWQSMAPNAGGEPQGDLAEAIKNAFGAFEEFKLNFTKAGMTRFGSGWAWLVKNKSGELEILSTANADNPMTNGHTPLLVCDVWEHAYYIDTRNDRGAYINNFWSLVNWDFVAANFAA
jgi:superoxide dismutase, Fe-Mn family